MTDNPTDEEVTEYSRGWRDGMRFAATTLSNRALEMRDDSAKSLLNGMSWEIGDVLKMKYRPDVQPSQSIRLKQTR